MLSCVCLCVVPAMSFLCVRLIVAYVLSFWMYMYVFDFCVLGDWVLAISVLLPGVRSCLGIWFVCFFIIECSPGFRWILTHRLLYFLTTYVIYSTKKQFCFRFICLVTDVGIIKSFNRCIDCFVRTRHNPTWNNQFYKLKPSGRASEKCIIKFILFCRL